MFLSIDELLHICLLLYHTSVVNFPLTFQIYRVNININFCVRISEKQSGIAI